MTEMGRNDRGRNAQRMLIFTRLVAHQYFFSFARGSDIVDSIHNDDLYLSTALGYSSFIVEAARSIPASTGQAGAPLQQID